MQATLPHTSRYLAGKDPMKISRRKTLWMIATALLTGCSSSEVVQPLAEQACPVPGVDGAPFEAPLSALQASFRCFPATGASGKPTVLLVHGTSLDSENNFSWNYIPALTDLGYPVCTVDLPNFGQDDIQASAEFVVHAIREAARGSAGKLRVVGYSQGGMIPRWALRFWPDTRELVEEVVAIAGSNHGTLVANAACAESCPASNWQQAFESNFILALNKDFETLPGIDYTNIYTHMDEIVQPNLDDSGSTSLAGGANVTNVAVQDVCPGHVADHLALGSYDAVAWALTLDALDNPGPADPARFEIASCAEPFMPGVNPASFAADYAAMGEVLVNANAGSDRPTEEPPLKCYVSSGAKP